MAYRVTFDMFPAVPVINARGHYIRDDHVMESKTTFSVVDQSVSAAKARATEMCEGAILKIADVTEIHA